MRDFFESVQKMGNPDAIEAALETELKKPTYSVLHAKPLESEPNGLGEVFKNSTDRILVMRIQSDGINQLYSFDHLPSNTHARFKRGKEPGSPFKFGMGDIGRNEDDIKYINKLFDKTPT
ncbi:MAG: hypothetical protein K9G62_06740 [Alphaproteobacteria bacterium]|nr:hypothetical protein [Alphaproteobacteria bacterium]